MELSNGLDKECMANLYCFILYCFYVCVVQRIVQDFTMCRIFTNKTFLCTISLISTTFSSDHRVVVFGLIHLLLIILL